MLTFFRRIRLNLLSENRFSRYLIYAIGEIILVVVGILIALQINNWNESRKARLKEVEILKDFQIALKYDILQIDSIFAQYDRAKASIDKILHHLEQDLPHSDSLDSDFFNTALVFDSGGLTDGAYETLKSTGFDLISNKEIRDLIILIYDEFNPYLESSEKRYLEEVFNAKREVYNSRFFDSWNGDYQDPNVIGTMKPLNYELLKNDNEFKYLLRTQRNDIGWLINKPVKMAQIECKKLYKLIEQELSDEY